ncbi:hypothetical protein [Zeaxanthinibacter enoshimensis]|uniref:Peptidoglycan-binding protein LysM n=1 Tax=Zeaxanthinibacter enoshimensis TaxID=392009 RepID=A0A4R6TT38_9FLAO|nr:hypothetical protein [Zeaxanthinibacter enoshimensis]TDQ31650.1 hypothetical protein CLV82_2359 [Zeaxanthinibacter enoshimensis]
MRKRILLSSPLIMIAIFGSFGLKRPVNTTLPETLRIKEPTAVLYPQYEIAPMPQRVAPPFLGSSYVGFKEALAFKESQGNYFVINTLGYLGKYQFGINTLQLMGVYNASQFLNDPSLQEKVFMTNLARNKWILRKDIEWFVGHKIHGVEVTESGILAAAHLAGAGNVKKYLRSYGNYDTKDAYGTSISEYMRKFSGYDVSRIMARKNPRI